MIPQTEARKKKNSSKVNLSISFTVHAVIIVALIYFAAREGYLGKKIQKITVTMVKEKQPDKPKEPDKPKVDQPKVEPPKVDTAKAEPPKTEAAPASVAPPSVAPANNDIPALEFDGGATVISERDPVKIYKSRIESTLRSKWNRPENMDDDKYVAEVAVDVDRKGNISNPQWQKGSGNSKWDATVRAVFDSATTMDGAPPTNFPPHVTVRFDVETEAIAEPFTQ